MSRYDKSFPTSVLCPSMSNKTFGGTGSGFPGVSLIARSDSIGIPRLAQAFAIVSVSMSTADAPVARAIWFRSTIESMIDGEVKSFALCAR